MSPPTKTQVRERLYQWHLRLGHVFLQLTPEQQLSFDYWRAGEPVAPDWCWPGWESLIGKRPSLGPTIVGFDGRERSA